MHSSVRPRTLALFALVGTALMSGCMDKRVKAVDTGITRDSMLTVIGKGAPGIDSLPNVYTRERYLIDSKNYEIMFFSPSGKHVYTTGKDTIPWGSLTPIAMVDSKVVGKGWSYIDSLYSAKHIPLKKH